MVILAAGIAVRNYERFAGMRIVEIPVQDAIKDPERIFAGLGA